MPNPETCTCSSCGYTWKHGKNGSHSCITRLVARVAELEEAGTITIRLLLQGCLAEALEHAQQNFHP